VQIAAIAGSPSRGPPPRSGAAAAPRCDRRRRPSAADLPLSARNPVNAQHGARRASGRADTGGWSGRPRTELGRARRRRPPTAKHLPRLAPVSAYEPAHPRTGDKLNSNLNACDRPQKSAFKNSASSRQGSSAERGRPRPDTIGTYTTPALQQAGFGGADPACAATPSPFASRCSPCPHFSRPLSAAVARGVPRATRLRERRGRGAEWECLRRCCRLLAVSVVRQTCRTPRRLTALVASTGSLSGPSASMDAAAMRQCLINAGSGGTFAARIWGGVACGAFWVRGRGGSRAGLVR
jgi:hypothetical protein